MVSAKKIVLARHFQGEPQLSDFKLETEELPQLKDDEVLAEAEFLSVDPYMRLYSFNLALGDTMMGGQVARVIKSKSPNWQIGDRVVANFGWRSHTIFDAKTVFDDKFIPVIKLPDIGNLSPSLGLGVLGMPGNTAYFGFLEVCQPKEGETVVVSGAAGAVGSIVGQIAKIKGCRVIGFAGSDDKVKWLTKELGFDAAYNYKTKDIGEALKESAPKGVDCYFDNVGGQISSTIMNHMNSRGRVSICGSICSYNADSTNFPQVPILQPLILGKQLRIEGFHANRWTDRWMEGITKSLEWIREGKLKYEETVTKGFENMPSAFISMLRGKNTGKAIVSV